MSFVPQRKRPVSAPRPARIVFAVGQRVFVHHPSDAARTVVPTNSNGIPTNTGLQDGVEVEVLAWLPRGSAGTRYRVFHRPDSVDGWLGADELRATALRPVPVVVTAPTVPNSAYLDSPRPFGGRRL